MEQKALQVLSPAVTLFYFIACVSFSTPLIAELLRAAGGRCVHQLLGQKGLPLWASRTVRKPLNVCFIERGRT